MTGNSVAAKSRQPWDHSMRLNNVSLHASSTSKAVSCNGSADQVDHTARRAAAEAELVKSVTLHNDSACLTQCPIGTDFKLRADQLHYPRANLPMEEFTAIVAQLAFFSWGPLLILLLPGCLAAAILYRSLPAMLFLAIITIDCILHPGKVNALPPLPEQHACMYASLCAALVSRAWRVEKPCWLAYEQLAMQQTHTPGACADVACIS